MSASLSKASGKYPLLFMDGGGCSQLSEKFKRPRLVFVFIRVIRGPFAVLLLIWQPDRERTRELKGKDRDGEMDEVTATGD